MIKVETMKPYEEMTREELLALRKELKARQIPSLKVLYSTEQPLKPQASIEPSPGKRAVPGSISFVPPAAGLIIAGEAIRDILQLS